MHPSVAASTSSTAAGVRSDVAILIASLPVTETQRAVLHQAALALQAALTVELPRRVELQRDRHPRAGCERRWRA